MIHDTVILKAFLLIIKPWYAQSYVIEEKILIENIFYKDYTYAVYDIYASPYVIKDFVLM